MKIAGIIAEYNPFHTGHAYHIEKTRALSGADAVAVIMSGHFVQRGGPAIADKWTRAEAAVAGGADVVFELPTYYAHAPAQLFAYGAVKSLMRTGVVDVLSFGAENENFEDIAKTVIDRAWFIEERLSQNLAPGMPYPVAYAMAVEAECGIPAEVFSTPNNMLALEYLKVLAHERSSIEPLCIARAGAGYHDTKVKDGFASATAIRHMLRGGDGAWKDYMPPAVAAVYADALENKWFPVEEKQFDSAVLAVLRRMSPEMLCDIADMPEGFANRISEMTHKATSVEDLISRCSVKHYTTARIRRLLWSCWLGLPRLGYTVEPTYLRALAFNETGTTVLKQMKEEGNIPLVIKSADFEADALFYLDVRATDLYFACAPNAENRLGNQDYTRSPSVIRM